MYVLGIESTCDETAAAIVEDGRKVISNVISTSVKEQALYGGVVPEIASRRHAEYISATVDKALADANMTMKDVDAVAVTFAPGLIGAVLVGVNFAKGLAYAAGKPLVPVHHLRGHIAANYLTHQSLHPPFLCLVASGGHSHIVMVEDWCRYKVLGRTVDDAAGEAYDKVARTLGLPPRKKNARGYSTDAATLESLRPYSPVIDEILKYRTYAKLLSTYVDGLLAAQAADGRVHSTFIQTETRTGRISSTEPNLQNIPIRTELGSQLRAYFVARPGCVLVLSLIHI